MKKTLVALLGAGLIAGGCAGKNATDVMRDNAYVLSQGGNAPIYLTQTTPENYQRTIDLIQNIGESGAVDGFTFPSVYSLPTTTEETKEKIALQVANRYTPAQLTNMTLRYWETLSAAEMSRWTKDAIIKDVISATLWGNLYLRSAKGSSSSGSNNNTQSIGPGTPNRDVVDVTRSAVSRSIQ